MLDLTNPKSAHIFAASRQLDVILGTCKEITTIQGDRRFFRLEVVRPTFAALRWLNAQRFGNSQSIEEAIDELERQADALAALPTSPAITLASPIICPSCGGELTKPHQYNPQPYCSPCLQMIMPSHGRLDQGFGTWAI
jgi:hypothetical protein